MRNTRFISMILFVFCLYQGCKVGDDDPLLSFRSRDKRLIGTWAARIDIGNGLFIDYHYRFQKNGEVFYSLASKDSFILYGIWRWVAGEKKKVRKESIIIFKSNKLSQQFFITSLCFKKIEFYTIENMQLPKNKIFQTELAIKNRTKS